MQFNKRDLPNVAPVEFMNFMLNQREAKALCFETVARDGVGIYECLNIICRMVMAKFIQEHNMAAAVLNAKDLAVKATQS
ncbi:MAG: hypothetical protein QME60_08265 [Verrucomicrobiota bacterium]|nr:hypothetical protein [Verrucomicrobiota bacterium]